MLERMDHPTAQAWLETLNFISPSQAFEKVQEASVTFQKQADYKMSLDNVANIASLGLIAPVAPVDIMPNVMALLGGIIGAVITGIIWATIVIETNFEIGYAAVGVGFITGYFASTFAQNKNVSIGFIAVVCSLLGIFIGKYATFYMLLREDFPKIDPLSQELWDYFVEFGGNRELALFSAFDLLWIILAVSAAWRVASGLGSKR
ncbi:MAG: hypothetical protein RLP44_13625 [Aggregatilineales bacterium]